MTRARDNLFSLTLASVVLLYLVLVASSCSTFQRQAKDGSDLRNHCRAYSQLCTPTGSHAAPDGTLYPASDLALRCSRLDEDAELWSYDCTGYLP